MGGREERSGSVSRGGGGVGTRGASKKGDGVGEEDKRKKLEKVGGAEGVEASGDIQFQVEVVK